MTHIKLTIPETVLRVCDRLARGLPDMANEESKDLFVDHLNPPEGEPGYLRTAVGYALVRVILYCREQASYIERLEREVRDLGGDPENMDNRN